MKKLGYTVAGIIAILIITKIIFAFGEAPEKVRDIISHWSLVWLKGGVIATIVGVIIFWFNKKFISDNMGLFAMFTFVLLIPALLYVMFGENTTLIIIGAISGVIIGYFTSIIDDHLLDAWEIRHVSLPVAVGIGFGASVMLACLVETWQDEKIYVTDHSAGTEVIVERYTYHYRDAKDGGSYYSWDHHETHYFIEHGEAFPQPKPEIDFELGTGAMGKTDRYSFSYHKWVGGHKFFKNEDLGFKWIYLKEIKLDFKKGALYDIDENYFGHAMKAKEKPIEEIDIPTNISLSAVPTSGDVPGAFLMFYQFFKLMFTNKDFVLLRWIYALMYIPFLVLILFIGELRVSFLIFLASSTIIILLILMAALAKSGRNLSELGERFSGFGGGKFGGAGAGSRW